MKKSILFFGAILFCGVTFSQNTFPTAANTAVGIGTGTTAVSGTGGLRLKVTSGVANTSGIQLSNLTSSSTTTSGLLGKALSVNSTGNLVLVPVANTDTSIYSADGILATNRAISMNSKNFLFKPLNLNSDFFINGTTGNVGLGNTTPAEKLDVTGTVKARQAMMRYSPANGTNYATFPEKIKACLVLSAGTPILDGGADAGTFNYMDFPSNSTDTPFPKIWMEMMDRGVNTRFRFFASQASDSQFSLHNKTGSEFFMLTEDGNGTAKLLLTKPDSFLGIGTSTFEDVTGTFRLSVKGGIRAERVKVYTTWADFVFEKNYDLPTLEEVEKHIQEKGHLKDIPSAKEVEANGIDLGDMNKRLLQKVEELTLYIIDMNKELQDVKSQLKKQ